MLHSIIKGKGKPIILLHGYMADSTCWGNLVNKLLANFKCVCIDLPGHGKSPTLTAPFTMQNLSTQILKYIKSLRLKEKPIVVGHSMGGYVALECIAQNPDVFEKVILLNSHPWPDTEKRILWRKKEFRLIESGRKELLVAMNTKINAQGASNNLLNFLNLLKGVSLAQKDKNILQSIEVLLSRQNHEQTLRKYEIQCSIIAGEKDEALNLNMLKQLSTSENISLHVLPNVGHFSFIEATKEVVRLVNELAIQ